MDEVAADGWVGEVSGSVPVEGDAVDDGAWPATALPAGGSGGTGAV